MKQAPEPVYLGDGVYATSDGWNIELRLNAHTDPVAVYLEPEVMQKLIDYHRALQEWRTT